MQTKTDPGRPKSTAGTRWSRAEIEAVVEAALAARDEAAQ